MSRLLLAPVILVGATTGLLLAGCGGGGSGSSTNPAVTQNVTGFVWDADTAAPVSGATVKVSGTNITATTAADGSYTVGPLNPTRKYNLLVSKNSYVDDVVTILTTNATLQGPQVILTAGNPAVSITNATGGSVTSNATLEGNTATITIPANALPGGAATGQVSATLIVGTATPSAPFGTLGNQIAYPVVNMNVAGASTDFASAVTFTLPLPFTMTEGSQFPVLFLGADGNWAPFSPSGTAVKATVDTGGKTASFTTVKTGTYALEIPMNASGTVTNTTRVTIPGPYSGPVSYDLTGTSINWSVTGADARDALDSTFVQNQRQGDINITGDLDATKLVINPRGTSSIQVVKTDLTVNVTSSGFAIAQAGGSATGDVQDLAHYEIVPHQQGSGGAN
jgi:hypothetical protein